VSKGANLDRLDSRGSDSTTGHGKRLAALIPGNRLELVADSYTLIMRDQPDRLAQPIDEFLGSGIEQHRRAAGPNSASRSEQPDSDAPSLALA
jgi:hypothetical protein